MWTGDELWIQLENVSDFWLLKVHKRKKYNQFSIKM